MRKRHLKIANMTDDERETSNVCRILLVEDDGPVRERLARIIGDWRKAHLIAACGTLAEATAAIRDNPVDLLITDLNLPDGHGVQAIRMLRTTRPDAESMVISVLADDRNVIEAIEAGASAICSRTATRSISSTPSAISWQASRRSPRRSRAPSSAA